MKCPKCDTEMIWNNDFDAQELTQEQYDLLSCHECPECKSLGRGLYRRGDEV